jgi:ABC-type multidrug transport system ATPase subunit
MEIVLDSISKRYESGWVIKDLSKTIKSGSKLSITGLNGTGKSTLIQILSGYLSPSKGSIKYQYQNKTILRNNIYKYLSIVAAYSELDEELTSTEFFEHFGKFKPLQLTSANEFLDLVDLKKQRNQAIKNFSSGMKQRLYLGLGIITQTPLLILDEPSSFLDDVKKQWMYDLIADYAQTKTIIVASNDPDDFQFCDDHLGL